MREEGGEGSMTARSSISDFFKILSSYNSNVLLAALVFLLLVVLFVLLLHFYARFSWSNSDQEFFAARRHRRRRRRGRGTVTTTRRIIPSVPLGGVDGEVSAAVPEKISVAILGYFCEIKQSNDVFEFLLADLSCPETCGIVERIEGEKPRHEPQCNLAGFSFDNIR